MANITDPLVNAVSGSDPQNLLEYITRQKIYDSRFWKEECFGLTVADVLEKAATSLQCMGGLPTQFLSLTLKLLQLHPEIDLVVETFVEQEEFKYVRALGCLYVRLMGRPVEIYETLEPLYRDWRKLRVWNTTTSEWSILHMDEWVHELLTSSVCVGMALPRLPSRAVLQEGGYLPDGPRATALKDVLESLSSSASASYDNDPISYFRYKVEVEQSPAAIAAWEKRLVRLGKEPGTKKKKEKKVVEEKDADEPAQMNKEENEKEKKREKKREGKPSKKKSRNYGSLFKDEGKSSSKSKASSSSTTPMPPPEEGKSEEYWDAERARLGLKPLKK